MKKKRKSNLIRNLYVFNDGILSINCNHTKDKVLNKWYNSGNMEIPSNLHKLLDSFILKRKLR